MKNLQKYPILTTAELLAGDEIYRPVSSKYWADVNERINYRGLRAPYHIMSGQPGYYRRPTLTHEQRYDRYVEYCLERGTRPYGYPDNLWSEYLSDCRHAEHTARCESANAWRYEN